MIITTLTIDKLFVDPLNVRLNEEDANATDRLEASLIVKGLIYPLIVRPDPVLPGSGRFGVIAGGRRMRAFDKIITRGELPVDCAIGVIIREGMTDKGVIELSASENLRRNLRPYELYAAYAGAHANGATVEEIAAEFGQRPKLVMQFLAIGNLAPPIFDAFAHDRISEDQAKAYAATEDHDLQLRAWRALADKPSYHCTGHIIRAFLKVGDREISKRLRFVGMDAYRAAGGHFELDLFAETGDRGRVENEEILARLWSAKLQTIREATKAVGAKPIAFVPAPPDNGYGGTDHTLFAEVEREEFDGFDLQEHGRLKDEQARLEKKTRALLDENLEVLPGKQAQIDKIEQVYAPNESRIAELEASRRWLVPEGQDIVAVIEIDDDGGHDLTWWYRDAKAKRAALKGTVRPAIDTAAVANPGRDLGGAKRSADQALKDEHGLSQEATEFVRSTRRQNLRAALIDDARAGRAAGHDFLIWSLARNLLTRDYAHTIGAVGMMSLDPNQAHHAPRLKASPAFTVFDDAVAEISKQSFITDANLAGAFLDFISAAPEIRNLTAAVVAGMALTRSANAPGYSVPSHDALAIIAQASGNVQIRRHWTPDTAFLDMLPKAERLSIAEPLVEPKIFGTWKKLKSGEVTAMVLRVVTGTAGSIRSRMGDAAATWVHPLLTYVGQDATPRPRPARALTRDQIDLEDHLTVSDISFQDVAEELEDAQ